jgi:hypothetical protein
VFDDAIDNTTGRMLYAYFEATSKQVIVAEMGRPIATRRAGRRRRSEPP